MNQVYTVLMLAFVGLVLAAQTAHGVGVMVLNNGTMVANNTQAGNASNHDNGSTGKTMLPNGSMVPRMENAPPGSKITNFTQFTNATGTYGSTTFHLGPKPTDNESIDNATGSLTGPSDHSYADYKRNVATTSNSNESKANSTGNLTTFPTTAFATNQNNTNSVDLNGSEPVAPRIICFGEWRCVSGWKHAIIQAQTDWKSGQYTKMPNGGNPDCPIKHTPEYCNGYAKGYTYEWNTLYQQTQTAPTYCSQTYLTQHERYNCGYNRGYLDAQTDWNLNRVEDNSCPRATEHTPEFCNGYAKGYTYEWNTLYSPTQPENKTTPTQPENKTIPTQPENKTIPTQPENKTIPTQPENKTIPTQPENKTIPTQPENKTIPTQRENKTIPTQPENKTIPTQPENKTIPTQPENKTIPTQPENKTIPTGPSLATLYNKGIDLYHLGNYTGALRYFDEILYINPKYIAALYGKGTDLFKLGNYSGAILYYDKTLDIDAKDVHALADKGVSLYKLGNYTGAIEYFDKALTVNPKHKNALYNKGLVLDEVGNHIGALTYLDKFLAIDPKDEDALYEKGVFLDKLGNHTGAIEYFDKALTVDPHEVRTHKWS